MYLTYLVQESLCILTISLCYNICYKKLHTNVMKRSLISVKRFLNHPLLEFQTPTFQIPTFPSTILLHGTFYCQNVRKLHIITCIWAHRSTILQYTQLSQRQDQSGRLAAFQKLQIPLSGVTQCSKLDHFVCFTVSFIKEGLSFFNYVFRNVCCASDVPLSVQRRNFSVHLFSNFLLPAKPFKVFSSFHCSQP